MLNLNNIYGGYVKDHFVLNGICLEIKKNEITAIIGQNGSGKSSLAKGIMGILPFLTGTILLDGTTISGKDTRFIINQGVGYFSQGGQVFPNLSIKENLRISGHSLSKKIFKERIVKLRASFGLLTNINLKKKASYLSQGEKHQLALIMTLMMSPTFIILDEPSAGLSPKSMEELYFMIDSIKNTEDITMLLIEQNIGLAFNHADKVYYLDSTGLNQVSNMDDLENKIFN